VVLPDEWRRQAPAEWVDALGVLATVVWRGAAASAEADMEAYEHAWVG